MTRTQPRPPATPLTPPPPHGRDDAPSREPGGVQSREPGDAPPRTPGGLRSPDDLPAPRRHGLAPTTTTPTDAPPRGPGGVPPRRPGARAVASGGRPPGSPGRSQRARTRPADTRPPTAGPGRGARTGALTSAGTSVTALVPGPFAGSGPAPAANAATAPTTGPTAPAVHRSARPAAAPLVPAQTPRRPVPQLRPTDRFAELLLGVLSGRRPVHSMLRHTVGRAYDDLAHLAERGPLRTRGTLPVVRDIGYFEPRPGALEVFARIGAGDRLRAMAFRLEQGRDLRWRCTAVELGGPRRPHTDDD
ncbi:Rv3235 family protein [Streptomyces sp. BBFR51]|uniref:Rv3235 family protein n=1 Tax=Streptomyces sp. BBFR51 TaxID=3372856 RepID=UPI0037DD1247